MESIEQSPRLANFEWLETNGIGGWASSTVSGAHSRRYHGLLVASLNPPTDRRVLLSRLDETIVTNDSRIELASRKYPDVTHPDGFRYLRTFAQTPFPTFEYQIDELLIRKTVVCVNGQNTTVVLYELLNGSKVTLELRPFIAGRDYHCLEHARSTQDAQIVFEQNTLKVRSFPGCAPFSITVPQAQFRTESDWYYQFDYAEERDRGLDSREDLFTPGQFTVELSFGKPLAVIISTQMQADESGLALIDSERQRRQRLVKQLPKVDALSEMLLFAADQFVVSRSTNSRTIIAGYHWFTDWGRDTMIALPGVCLVTGRFEDAKAILREFSRHVSEGMLPNRFPDSGTAPEYNTIDATLWFFVAAFKYLQYTGDIEFIRDEILPVLHDIVAWHIKGTRYDIHVTDDGLLTGGSDSTQLTWMDVKIGSWVATPRHGKAVEINALWYNALQILADLSQAASLPFKKLRERAERVQRAFVTTFWNNNEQCLYDCVRPGFEDASIRPNQIFALSLPFPLLDQKKGEAVLDRVERELLTPRGLRSLSPQDPSYRGVYAGDPGSRDSAYHQGTVWSWLLGPYVTALCAYRGPKGRSQARRVLSEFAPHLGEAGLGTISEIFDGAEPYTPRGCMAQAWSVGEVLRAYIEDICEIYPSHQLETSHGINAL